jgi:PPOX class probable F420-dependent enzyme
MLVAMSVNEIERLATARYVSLTTYRRGEEPCRRQVWVVRDSDALLLTASESSDEIQRIQHDKRVTLAPCDLRGRLQGTATTGIAEIRPSATDLETYKELAKQKYDWTDFLAVRIARLGKPKEHQVTLWITLQDDSP